jgi:hypothetical protein
MEIIVAKGCPDLFVDLQAYDTFALAAKVKVTFTAGGPGEKHDLDASSFVVKPGGALTKNMLRVFYKWPVITDFMSAAMSNLKGGKTLHFATVTWQNEPFDD